MQFIDIRSKIKHILLPQSCLLCGAASGRRQLCDGCERELPFHRAPSCPICAMPTPRAEICGACLKHPPHFDATRAAFTYAFPIDALLRALKYQERLAMTELAGEYLAQCLINTAPPDLIVPMPLHAHRLQERGFNQAIEIARIVADRTGVPCLTDGALRVRKTEPQASLPLNQRARNIRNAFACASDVAGKRIAIVDDVMTSGASLNELARTFKSSGAARVECWVVARTLRD